MNRSRRASGSRRAGRSRVLPVTALALAALLPTAGSVAAQPLPQPQAATADSAPTLGDRPPVPQARAFDKNNKPMASVAPVLRYCNRNPAGCNFKMTRAFPLQFRSVVKSLGNAVVNCTNHGMTVDRTVELKTSSQDNLGGEITGSIALEGTINASGEVSAGVNGEGSVNAKTPNMKEGPMSEAGAKVGANASGKVGGSVGLKAAFSGAFKAQYQRSWTTTHTESTKYHMEVDGGDSLVFEGNASMERISGILSTNNGQRITNVIVDAPSSINTSSFMARTVRTPPGACNQLHP
ncbi:hypothetical protein ABTY53_22205 [Streptomyces noursei]|uniref:hypothetical protein n=1 Tax=Streptomyces noursei TaxID=1971 RepID=UPI00331F8557